MLSVLGFCLTQDRYILIGVFPSGEEIVVGRFCLRRIVGEKAGASAQVSSWGNILTGLTNVVDPVTGTQFQVFSGPKSNYYINGVGDKINSNLSPGASFHQMENVGP
jgi:hypothetical protein